MRVDREVADLAAVAGNAGERLAVDDEAATDTHLAPDEEHVVRSDRRTASELGERAQVSIVRDGDRQRRVERPGDALSERNVGPAQVRGDRDEAVAATHDADHRDADPDERRLDPGARLDPLRELGQVRCDFVDGRVSARAIDPDLGHDLTAQPDDRGPERVDGYLEREDRGSPGVEADER